jgi:hypothetical protein
MWIKLNRNDIKKISSQLSELFFKIEDDSIEIVWISGKNILSSSRKINRSIKKTIIETVHNPKYHMSLDVWDITEIKEMTLEEAHQSHVTSKVIDQESNDPVSPVAQS